MLARFLLSLSLVAGLASACECIDLPAKDAKQAAEVVFRGTAIALRDSGKGYPIAIFRISRVWKGHVPEKFEMPVYTISCGTGFQLNVEVNSEFLVFGERLAPTDDEYIPIGVQHDSQRMPGSNSRNWVEAETQNQSSCYWSNIT